MSLTDFKSSIDLVLMGINIFARAANEAFQLGKEGAQLDYTRDKFDRLAESIGTTGDALMTDLRRATRGMMSDAELVASAADLMALGLAKSHDEAVRLATVAGGLKMNMNQLVLTLTNQTTMRFDALGVAVDGFNEKVKELEKSGMSASDAFREAFLQQAEQQLEKVGEAADSAVGPYQRLETAIKNQIDAFKLSVSEGMTPVIAVMAEVVEGQMRIRDEIQKTAGEIQESAGSWDEYAAAVMENIKQRGYFTKAVDGQILVFKREGNVIYDVTTKFDLLAEAEWKAAVAIEKMRAATEAAHGPGRNWADLTYETGDALDYMSEKAAAAAEASAAAAEAARKLALSFSEVDNARLASVLLNDLTTAYREGEISAEEYRVMSAKVASTLGDIPASQIAASTALFTLQHDYASGKLTLDEYITAVQKLGVELNGIPKNIQVLIDIKTSGDAILSQLKGGGIYGGGTPAPRPATNTGRSTGTPGGYREPGFASGGSFVVPPGYPNDSFVMRVSSGEHVQVTPAGKSGGGGGGVYIENLIISGADSPEATGHAVVSRLRKTQARSGMGDYGGR